MAKKSKEEKKPKKPKKPPAEAPPAGGGAGLDPATAQMMGAAVEIPLDFDFGGLFQASKLESFFKNIMLKVSSQSQQLQQLTNVVNGLPAKENLEGWRTEITNYVDSFQPQLLKSAADRNTELLAQHSARMGSMQTMISDLQMQLQNSNENTNRASAEAQDLRMTLDELRHNSVEKASMDLLEMAQKQSCREWRATGEKMEEMMGTVRDMQRVLLDKCDDASAMALAERLGVESQRMQETAAAMDAYTEMGRRHEEAISDLMTKREQTSLIDFHTAKFQKDTQENLATVMSQVSAQAAQLETLMGSADEDGDGIPDWVEDLQEKILAAAADNAASALNERAESDQAAQAANKEAEEAAAAEASANKEAAEADEAEAAAAKELEEMKQAEEKVAMIEKQIKEGRTGLEGSLKAAKAELAKEKGEAEESAKKAEEERKQADTAAALAEEERRQADAAEMEAHKQAAEAEAAEKAAVGNDVAAMKTMMERLAGRVIHYAKQVEELSKGGGGVASGTVQRLQEELIINTQKTENELDRMSEYLDKMSEQLASLWEQKANLSEVSTLRADVDALLGQREGDVMQIKDVLQTMESSLRNPSLPSTAMAKRGKAGGVAGMVRR